MDAAFDIDLRQPALSQTRIALEAVAGELERMWSSAIVSADFDEVNRLVEASHAVHRALLALGSGAIITSM
jgi:hypothetical protein